MADKRWKRVEREKCRAIGGERTGPRGFGLPDCVGTEVALEIKSYKTFVFLSKDWEQAVENAARVGKPPVLAVKETGRGRDLVQIRLRDLIALEKRRGYYGRDSLKEAGLDHEGFILVRITWCEFVQLYKAAYPTEEE